MLETLLKVVKYCVTKYWIYIYVKLFYNYSLVQGCWDSIHVIEVIEKSGGRNAHYKITSTVMLWLQTNKEGSGSMNLSGSLTRQVSQNYVIFFVHSAATQSN